RRARGAGRRRCRQAGASRRAVVLGRLLLAGAFGTRKRSGARGGGASPRGAVVGATVAHGRDGSSSHSERASTRARLMASRLPELRNGCFVDPKYEKAGAERRAVVTKRPSRACTAVEAAHRR